MEELLQPLDIDQIVMLLKAINCEEVDYEFWMVFSSDYTWNANEVFGIDGVYNVKAKEK